MKRKKRARQEKIVHRVQINSAQRREYEHQEEKEEQRYRRKIRNSPSQRTWLQFLRHPQRNIEARNEILIIPFQFPALGSLPFLRGRQRILREIESAKIGLHQQMKVLHSRNFVSV